MTKAFEEFPSAHPPKGTSPGLVEEMRALRGEIAAARKAIVDMILYSDRHGPDQLRLVNDSANRVSSHFSRLQVPAEKEAEFKELKEIWAAFLKTRETELVPAILAEDKPCYERIGAGPQKKRLDRMYALITLFEMD